MSEPATAPAVEAQPVTTEAPVSEQSEAQVAAPQETGTLLQSETPEQATSTDPAQDSWVTEGKFTSAFYDQLGSEETKSIMEKYQGDPLKAIKALDESQRFIGKRLAIPNGESDPAVLSKFREVNNIPETPDGYNIKSHDLPEGVEFDEKTFLSAYAPLFHELNLTPAQAEAIVEKHIEVQGARFLEESSSVEGANAAFISEQKSILEKEFGTNYSTKISDAQRFAQTIGLDMNDPTIGNNANFIMGLARGASMMSPDRLVPPAEIQTAQSYGATARDIQTNRENPDHLKYLGQEGTRQEQDNVRERVRRLIEKAQS